MFLNARRTDEKYLGSYETTIMKRFGQFANSTHVDENIEKLFASIAMNCALPNGDAHLTPVYLPKDSMALTLQGTTKWASVKELERLGETRMGGTPARFRQMLESIAAAIAHASKELRAYVKANAEFMEIGNRMLHQWEEGVALSLKAA